MPDLPEPASKRLPRSGWLALAVALVLLATGVAVAVDRGSDDARDRRAAGSTSSTTGTTGAPAPGTTTTPAPPPSPHAAVLDTIKAQVAEIRGLAWKAPLDLRVVTSAELSREIKVVIDRDRRLDRLMGDGETLKLLKLIPRASDYKKIVDDLYGGAVIGFYDPETKKLLVAGEDDGSISPGTKVTIAHEMLHALTDQHFNFGPKTDALDMEDRQEELAGYASLLEGDAKLLEELWSERHLTRNERRSIGIQGDPGVLARTPRYLRDSLLFPYTSGLDFVLSQYSRRDSFSAVNEVYRRPPTSTEHVLHPETYAANQGWKRPALPALPAATGCAPVRTGTLGEFTMAELLDEHVDDDEAEAAAAGWNGDVFSVVRCGSALGMANRWEADSERDATELASVLARWSKAWSRSPAATGADGRFSGPGGSGRVSRSGTRVDLVLADDGPTADRVAAAVGI